MNKAWWVVIGVLVLAVVVVGAYNYFTFGVLFSARTNNLNLRVDCSPYYPDGEHQDYQECFDACADEEEECEIDCNGNAFCIFACNKERGLCNCACEEVFP